MNNYHKCGPNHKRYDTECKNCCTQHKILYCGKDISCLNIGSGDDIHKVINKIGNQVCGILMDSSANTYINIEEADIGQCPSGGHVIQAIDPADGSVLQEAVICNFPGVYADGVTIIGTGTEEDPFVAVGGDCDCGTSIVGIKYLQPPVTIEDTLAVVSQIEVPPNSLTNDGDSLKVVCVAEVTNMDLAPYYVNCAIGLGNAVRIPGTAPSIDPSLFTDLTVGPQKNMEVRVEANITRTSSTSYITEIAVDVGKRPVVSGTEYDMNRTFGPYPDGGTRFIGSNYTSVSSVTPITDTRYVEISGTLGGQYTVHFFQVQLNKAPQ